MLISDAFAQSAGAISANSTVGMIVQLLLIFMVFYFILIRPQKKKIMQHEAMLAAIVKGDKIVTGGGIIGVVEKANGDKLDVKIAEGVVVSVDRFTVRGMADSSDVVPQSKSSNTTATGKKVSKVKKNK